MFSIDDAGGRSARLRLLVAERLLDRVPYAGVLTRLAPYAVSAPENECAG